MMMMMMPKKSRSEKNRVGRSVKKNFLHYFLGQNVFFVTLIGS